jgi:hypothetical protein
MPARKKPSPPLPPLPTSPNLRNPTEGSRSLGRIPPLVVSASAHTTAGDAGADVVEGAPETEEVVSLVAGRRQPALVGHAKSIAPPARLEGESPEQHERFLSWLLPGDGQRRSFAAVGRKHGLATPTVAETAARYSWRDRAIAYDRRVVAASAERAGQLAAEAGTNALALCVALKDQVAGIVAQLDDEPDSAVILAGALDASKVLERLVKTERLILGLSTQNQSVIIDDKRDAKLDYAKANDEQLQLVAAWDALETLLGPDAAHGARPTHAAELEHAERLLRWCPLRFQGRTGSPEWHEHQRRLVLLQNESAQ